RTKDQQIGVQGELKDRRTAGQVEASDRDMLCAVRKCDERGCARCKARATSSGCPSCLAERPRKRVRGESFDEGRHWYLLRMQDEGATVQPQHLARPDYLP